MRWHEAVLYPDDPEAGRTSAASVSPEKSVRYRGKSKPYQNAPKIRASRLPTCCGVNIEVVVSPRDRCCLIAELHTGDAKSRLA